MAHFNRGGLLTALIPVITFTSYASANTYDKCLLEKLQQADDSTTAAELRQQCTVASQTDPESILSERMDLEKENLNNRFSITPHRPNYVLPISYNSRPNTAPYNQAALTEDHSNTEIKFQLSLKAPLMSGLFNRDGSLWVAYTNVSWWQAYNSNSAPFRETNHEPEIFYLQPINREIMGFDLKMAALGLSHQSNGRGGDLSRSWNRLYAMFVFTKDHLAIGVKPWWRIPESEKQEGSAKGDDNPDISRYMGHGELFFDYKLDRHNIGVMVRNNLRSDNKGAVQLDWSFPINDRFRGYIQYFNGYGESLIDYNASTNRLSIGVMLTDWL